MEDFAGYIELVEDDSTLVRDPTDPVRSPSAHAIPPDLLWYMGRHPAKEAGISSGRSPADNPEGAAISRAKVIERLLNADSHQSETQTEPGDFCISDKGDSSDSESSPSSSESELPFLSDTNEETEFCHQVHATNRSKKAGPALLALIDLSNVYIANEQDADPNLGPIKEILLTSPQHPTWNSMHAECAEIKTLWSQNHNLKIQDGALLRHRKNQGPDDGWQIVAPQSLHTHIFQACHHHELVAHQGIVSMISLIKWRFYLPNMHQDVEYWCQRCSVCGQCKTAVCGHEQLQQLTYGSFNERVSVDLMGPFKQMHNGNDYIVVMQDHFTEWVEVHAICSKEVLTVADAVVQDWIQKHRAPISLHSDRGREFTMELQWGVCDLLCITKTYSTAYHPQANGMVEGCNRMVLSMLRAVVCE